MNTNRNDVTSYPLSWPAGQLRTPRDERRRASFRTQTRGIYNYRTSKKHTIAEGAKELENEIRRMGGDSMVISSDLRVKFNGLPYSNQRDPEDPGIAAYFKWHDRDLVFACDKWIEIEDNLWAIVKHIEALRGQERWGVGSLDQAFAGYMALPDPSARRWWEVLHISRDSSIEEIKRAYFNLAKQYHPDQHGDPEIFLQINKAYEEGAKEKEVVR